MSSPSNSARSGVVVICAALSGLLVGCPGSPPGAFTISGVIGGADATADDWLASGTAGTIAWEPSTGASSYEATLYEEDGTTVKCATATAAESARQQSFSGCELVEGRTYRAQVVAVGAGGRTPATNGPFPFRVGYFILGQPDGHTNDVARLGLSCPLDAVKVGAGMAVADCCNNRVLLWRSMPTQNLQAPDLVLGQPDLSTGIPNYGGLSARTFSCPLSIASNGTRLFVADRNNRVLGWNAIPMASFQAADLVLGQPDMTTATPNTGGLSAQSLNEPAGVSIDGTRLLVTDRYNSRVLIWNTLPTVQRQAADVVVGQPNMTSGAANQGGSAKADSLNEPMGRAYSDGTRLFVTDSLNHRVLLWNAIPTANGAVANVVLGQPDLTTAVANNGGISAQSLSRPTGVVGDATRIAVADNQNHRVLLWSTTTAFTNRRAADLVVGQPDMTSGTANTGGLSGNSLAEPSTPFLDGTNLIVTDRFNHRILLWTPAPGVSVGPANLVLGQRSVTTSGVVPVSRERFNAPGGVASIGGRFALGDGFRALFWNGFPAGPGEPPAMLLGEPTFDSSGSNAMGVSARTLCSARALATDGTRLFAADLCNHRVLIWNALPTMTQQPADVVLGQPNLGSNAPNNGGLSASSLLQPRDVLAVGGRLFVADSFNNRVLVWNTLPSATGAPATLVLGQPDLTSNTGNNGGVSAQSLLRPTGLASDGTRLLVVDSGNHRVLVWNSLPTTMRQAADVVLGQRDMGSAAEGTGAARLSSPNTASLYQGRLYVADSGNNRILVWSTLPTTNGAAADRVVGQVDMTSGLPNPGGLTGHTLSNPWSALPTAQGLYISDSGNVRVVVQPLP